MSSSLQEQLLKAGLVNQQQAKQVRTEKRKKPRMPASAAPAGEADKLRALQVQAEKAVRDRELNRKQAEEVKQREIAEQVRQLIEEHRIKGRDGDVAYHFADGTRLKYIYVNAKIHNQLTDGVLAITKLNGRYELVPLAVGEKIRERSPGRVVIANQQTAPAPDPEDDIYKDYKVPDDLIW